MFIITAIKRSCFSIIITMIIISLIGCETITPLGKEWRSGGRYYESNPNNKINTYNLIQYKLGELHCTNNRITIHVTNDCLEESYNTKLEELKERRIEYKTEKIKKQGQPIFALVFIGMAIVYKPLLKLTNSYSPPFADLIYYGLCATGLIISLVGKVSEKTTTKPTGKTKDSIISRKVVEGRLLNRKTVYNDKPAYNKKVTVESDYFKFLTRDGYVTNSAKILTDISGNVQVEIKETSNIFAFEKNKLYEKINSLDLIKDIRSDVRGGLLDEIKNNVTERSYLIEVKTEEIGGMNVKVTNDKRAYYLSGYEIRDEDIYNVIGRFINREINSKIKTISIQTRDIDSHVTIPHTNFEIKTNVPSPGELANVYFRGRLLNWAISRVDGYVMVKTKLKSDDEGLVKFNVFIPQILEIEITHAKYNYSTGYFKFETNKLEKTVYMSELGTKVRVKIVDK